MRILRNLLIIFICLISFTSCAQEGKTSIDNINLYELYETNSIKKIHAKPLGKSLIASKYLFGEEFNVPSIKLSFEGKEYDTKSYVKFPNGKITEKTTIKLNESGEYEVIYLAKFEHGMLNDSYKFVVTNELYSIVGEKSTVYYGKHEYMPDTNGIITSIRPNESFVYNKPIDLTTFTKNNKIVTLNVLPNNIGIADAQKILIKLTDIYDSNNYIVLEMKKVEDNKLAWAENATYVAAYSNGQDSCGLEAGSHPNTGRVVEYNGSTYTIHQNNYYGTWTGYAMTGAPRYQSTALPNYNPEYVGEQEFSVAMDYANGVIYGGPFLSLVNDLRSDIIYGSNFWTGFTTGEAYLSISALNYNAESVNLIIKEIAGESTENMSENLFADNTKPTLEVLWSGEYPVGLVGHKYPIFNTYSYDEYDHEEKDVKVSVYLNYGLSNQVNIEVVDGGFIPKFKATYYIHYSVTDKTGNTNEIVIPIEISDNTEKICIENISDAEISFNVGEEVTIKNLSYKNIVGSLKEKITATLKSDSSITYEIIDGKFIPLYSGEYEIKYEFSDFIFSDSYSYNITVNHTNKPLILDEIILENYYIKGCDYTLPTYYGYIFKDGKPIETPLEIYVTEGSNVIKINDYKYKPNYNGEITISYVLTNEGIETRKDVICNSIEVGYESSLEMGKYFYSDNVTITPEGKYIEYTLVENKNTKLEFINSLPSSNFSIRLAASDSKNNFTKINLYLTDVANPNIKIKFTYEKEPTGYVKFYINDQAATNYNTLFASSESPIICEYNNRNLQVSPHPTNYQLITETIYGEKFSGFISDKISLEIELEGVSGESALRMINLCGQPFTKVKADIIEPKVYVYNDVGEFDINSIYVLSAATIVDVLDPNITAFIRVKDPTGEFVTSENGVLLDQNAPYNVEHSIKLEKYGIYQVYYEAVDTNDNKTTYSFVINVVDKEVPTVSIINPVTTAKKGDTIDISSISIIDNYSEVFDIYVCMIVPNGQCYSLTTVEEKIIINKSFTAIEPGKYEICYYVADESGNTTFISYTINVE